MTPDRLSGKSRFETRFNEPTIVVLKKGLPFPSSFTHGEEVLNVITLQSTRTESRKDWQGKVLKHLFVVKTDRGLFELQHDEIKNSWTLVGKLREVKQRP